MNGEKNLIYEFDSYRLDPAERLLTRGGETIQLSPKAFETLVVLVESSGHPVDNETLLKEIWADSLVEEGNVKICVHALREALKNPDFIEIVPKRGYRFAAPIKVIEKTTGEFSVDRRTVSRNTIATTEYGEPGKIITPPAFIQKIAPPKIYVPLMLLICAGVFGVFYFSHRTAKNAETLAANPLAGVKTIAVLPLKSLSRPLQDQELRAGMADSIVTKLNAVRQIAVRPTSSTIRYLDQDYDAVEVGKILKVDSVLEGSLEREGHQLKVNLQMISVADGKVLWTDSFTSDLSNALNGQDSIAVRVARLMNVDADLPDNPATSSPSLTAQQLYLKGVYALTTSARKIENIVQARNYFEQSIQVDPNFALAYSGLANTYTLAASLNLLSPQESFPEAEQSARRALSIDPNLAQAHVALGNIETDYNWNWRAGESEFKRAIELAPNLAVAHGDYSEFLARMGRFDEADYQMNLARQLNPVWINYEAVHILQLFYARRFDEAIEQGKIIVEKDPNAYLAWIYLSGAQSAKGNYAAAIEADRRASAITGGAPSDLVNLGGIYALLKDDAKMNEILAKLETLSKKQYVDPFMFASIYAVRGDKDKAFAYLDICYKEKSYWITALKVFPFLDGLRSDARFTELLRKVNLND